MRKILEFLFLSVAIIASSCNRDEVITASLPPKIIVEDSGNYRVQVGDEIRIAPRYENVDGATFSWTIESVEVATTRAYVYMSESVGVVEITLTVIGESGVDSYTFEVESVEPFKVYDYTPAPGQFINDLKMAGFKDTETSMAAAIKYAERRILNNQFVSLGAFGGYIVLGLEHSITNDEANDFAILGNAIENGSEPGIVWVMQDENANGLPDDTWYELAGSESGSGSTIQNYAVTYYRPSGEAMGVEWSDNLGQSGVVEYLEDYHSQPSYYPQWIDADSYTLQGTRLEARGYDKNGDGALWVLPAIGWGYVDNLSEVDFSGGENHFDISNAVDSNGVHKELSYIDFVKVQSAVQQQCGWVGELSTEVRGIREL